jgi:hypothetical protein
MDMPMQKFRTNYGSSHGLTHNELGLIARKVIITFFCQGINPYTLHTIVFAIEKHQLTVYIERLKGKGYWEKEVRKRDCGWEDFYIHANYFF